MGIGDKAKNKAEELAGKAKAGVGDALRSASGATKFEDPDTGR
jgi:uncharacterized protein YjbJ (UPF0337 family)